MSSSMPNPYAHVDPFDWSTVAPHFDALQSADLQPDTTRDWLQAWSDLTSVLEETAAQVYREVTENTADPEASARYTRLVVDILPAAARCEQALKQKLFAVDGYVPDEETTSAVRRFRAAAAIYREENIPLISETRLLEKRYDEIIGGLSIEWEGAAQTIPQAEVLLGSPDRAVREQVWRQTLASYLAHRQELNDTFMQMLQLRRQIARNAGFS